MTEPRGRIVGRLTFDAAIGPVPAASVEVRPLTVFVGKQGTGKSLVAQLLYFFEGLPALAQLVGARSARLQKDRVRRNRGELVSAILDQLRSGGEPLAPLIANTVEVEWKRDVRKASRMVAMLPYEPGSELFPAVDTRSNRHIDDALAQTETVSPAALYCPSERVIVPLLRSVLSAQALQLPLTFVQFDQWLSRAAAAIARRQSATEQSAWVHTIGKKALEGFGRRRADQWEWSFVRAGKRAHMKLDLASSGQRANFSLFFLARALFRLRDSGEIAPEFTLFVEEPEIHLHPGAQEQVARMLAFLVHHGFRVVVTTHSLMMLYAFNNLVQASRVRGEARGVPEEALRIPPEDLAVYHFQANQTPRSVVDRSTGFIDESALGSVAEDLQEELNIIAAARRRKHRE